MNEQKKLIRFKVFGSDQVLETHVGPGNNFMDLLKELGLFPDDFIVTCDGVPLPIDSSPEDNKDYMIYKVPSGG